MESKLAEMGILMGKFRPMARQGVPDGVWLRHG